MPAGTHVELAAELLLLAATEPTRGEVRARALLTDTQDPWLLSVARHALGLALRERGDLARAVPELRTAVRLATRSGDPDREADVRATLGAALAMAGRTGEGLAQLDRAVAGASEPALTARVLMRRGYVLSVILGRHHDAVADLEGALRGARAATDRVWEARTLNNLGQLHLAVGEVTEAEAAVVAAHDIFRAEGQDVEAAQALENRGFVAFCRGDLPTALAVYDETATRYAELGVDSVDLAMDRCATLLAAGLAREAVGVVDAQLGREHLQPTERAELQLRLATALLALGEGGAALVSARAARDSFRRHQRDWWAVRAEMASLRARHVAGLLDRRMARRAAAVAEALETGRSEEAVEAWLLAGQVGAHFHLPTARPALRRAAAYRTDRVALVSATGWLARALEGEMSGDRRGVFLACRRGLDALDAHRASLGSSELRALATVHGADLARLALKHAVEAPPRNFLWWSERWRATSLAQPPVRPDSDDQAAPLVALRDNGRRLQAARNEGRDTSQLESERAGLEDQVRRLLHHTAGDASGAITMRPRAEQLVEAAGDAAFVELVEVEDVLHAVVVTGGRVRAAPVGAVAEADRAVEYARFVLRQAARGRPAAVEEAGRRLQAALLGRRVAGLAAGKAVVLSPTSRLHAAPWGLLPVLAEVPHSVVPSGALWLRARERDAASDHRVFVSGPGLTTGGAEIGVVAPRHPDALVLGDGSATVEECLRALDGAGLAHIAAHGHFRTDSPLFSSLDLDDGPLTVYDFERLARPPHRVVLSACESGVMAPVGAGELLGLVAALLSIGTVGVVASVVAVNDEATVEVMVDVHDGLDGHHGLADVLLRARESARDDPVRMATAGSFLALGV